LLNQIFRGSPFNRKDSHENRGLFCTRFADCEPLKTSGIRERYRQKTQRVDRLGHPWPRKIKNKY
jgi:hypothetical protein